MKEPDHIEGAASASYGNQYRAYAAMFLVTILDNEDADFSVDAFNTSLDCYAAALGALHASRRELLTPNQFDVLMQGLSVAVDPANDHAPSDAAAPGEADPE